MNRRDRRAALARGKTAAASTPADIPALAAEATLAYKQGRIVDAEVACRQVLARAPAHPEALNILGVVYQASGNHRLAAKTLAKLIAVNDLDAACHYNIATSYQALKERDAAVKHFKKAIALGLSGKGVEPFLMQNTVVAARACRMTDERGLPVKIDDLFDPRDIAAIADNIFLRCALESTIVRGVTLELFLTDLRHALLRLAIGGVSDPVRAADDVLGLFCALAQQCFLNEYVFDQTADETQRARQLRESLVQRLSAGGEVPALLLAAVAAYFPLHAVAGAKSLLGSDWPPDAADLLRRQVREPLEEAEDRRAIPALTAIEDRTSLDVMQQYEENPYPRWTINPLAALGRNRTAEPGAAVGVQPGGGRDILIAGCGTGEHPFDIAQKAPEARILAVDLSLASLAYARRKTREERLRNIEYAQADILKLSAIGRTFDRIEAVGVLHHLADPKAGWRVLLSLLAPGGTMRVGLYSEAARRAIVEARALIAERGYPPTAEGIRALRQTIIREKEEPRWKSLVRTVDFYSMSGCRDIFFHVMEHRLTIPEIKSFLDEHGLSFLGFEAESKITEKFDEQYPGADARTNLDYWNSFEAANPLTFLNMYIFSVRDDRAEADPKV
jgi:SAM-dependent methyltransferase